jgi:hypothetical protein
VRSQKLELIATTEAAVKDRLTKEINYWDHRAETLKLQEVAGRANARLNSNEARKRADNLQGRLQRRMEELQLEAKLSPLPPVILGGVLVVPATHPRLDPEIALVDQHRPAAKEIAVPFDHDVESRIQKRVTALTPAAPAGERVGADREVEGRPSGVHVLVPGCRRHCHCH